MQLKSNIVLIGMPGAGKSTVGQLLAKRLGRRFVDTDQLIEVRQNASLQQILDSQGNLQLREIEQQTILTTTFSEFGDCDWRQCYLCRLGVSLFTK